MKYALSLLVLCMNLNAFADCAAAYKARISAIEGRLNPPRTTVIANIIAEGAVVAALSTAGAVTVGGVVALPAAALGAGAYYSQMIIERNGIRNGMHVLAEAHKGEGTTLKRFMRILERKLGDDFNEDEALNILRQGDFDNTFCVFNDVKDTYKLMNFRKLLRYTKNKLLSDVK